MGAGDGLGARLGTSAFSARGAERGGVCGGYGGGRGGDREVLVRRISDQRDVGGAAYKGVSDLAEGIQKFDLYQQRYSLGDHSLAARVTDDGDQDGAAGYRNPHQDHRRLDRCLQVR